MRARSQPIFSSFLSDMAAVPLARRSTASRALTAFAVGPLVSFVGMANDCWGSSEVGEAPHGEVSCERVPRFLLCYVGKASTM